MTFKHNDFNSSPTMRSLVKVATEKGWIVAEPLKKTASTDLDLSSTSSLTENILKLCAGLKQSGLNKYADEIETTFFTYKKASELYNISKETGEDLVDTAHPDGGHQMEDVEGDAFIETILEKHLKMLNMIDKKPSGKLASHKSILSAVKLVLAQALPSELTSLIREITASLDEIIKSADQETDLPVDLGGVEQRKFNSLLSNPTVFNLEKAKIIIKGVYLRLEPGMLGTTIGVTEYSWNQIKNSIKSKLATISEKLDQAIEIRQAYDQNPRAHTDEQTQTTKQNQAPGSPTDMPSTDPSQIWVKIVNSAFDKLIERLNSFKSAILAKHLDKKTQDLRIKSVSDEITTLNTMKNQFAPELGAAETFDQKKQIVQKYQAMLENENKSINDFYAKRVQ